MKKPTKICPDCERENPTAQKKCQFCGAVLHYGKDYYKLKSFLSWITIFGISTGCLYTSLSKSKFIDPAFFENILNWVSYIIWGFAAIGVLCRFLVGMADVDETFIE